MKVNTETFSIFGQIEAAAAEHMITQGKATRIPLDHFPSRRLHPDVWQNKDGAHAKFAIRIPKQHLSEFNEVVANLRA